jgi:Rrf2 family protein
VKFTRACGSALEAVVFLAQQKAGQEYDALKIAREKGLSVSFLRKILGMLVSAQVLRSVRGPGGGYHLARLPQEITLLKVVETVDGPIRGEVPALEEASSRQLDRRLGTVTNDVATIVREQLEKVTIADLLPKRK